MQTRLAPYFETLSLTLVNDILALDFSGLETLLGDKLAADDVNGVWDAIELESVAGQFFWSSNWSALEYLANADVGAGLSTEARDVLSQNNITLTNNLVDIAFEGTNADDIIVGGSVNDVINGLDGGDRLYGNTGDDLLSGGAGNDTLVGGDGADTLDGGAGFDTLIGGAGDDILGGAADSTDATSRTWNGNTGL